MTAPAYDIEECVRVLDNINIGTPLRRSLLHHLRAAQAAAKENERLTGMVAELHRMIGRGDHGNAKDNHSCAVSGLVDILSASRENSAEACRFEEELEAARREADKEAARWQQRIEETIRKAGLTPCDPSGNESGDPLDWSDDQIHHALEDAFEKGAQAAASREAEIRAEATSGCPCRHTTPCQPRCTCAMPGSSSGCRRCCTYGSKEQRESMARHLAEILDAGRERDVEIRAEAWEEGYDAGDSDDDSPFKPPNPYRPKP